MADNNVQPVVDGKVSKTSKSLWRKIFDTFSAGNFKDAKNYVVKEVIIPGFFDILYDAIVRGAGKLIYKDKEAIKTRHRDSKGGINYSGIVRVSDGESYRGVKKRAMENSSITEVYDYNEVLLESRSDAAKLLDSMQEYLEAHDFITVADMYAMAHYDGGDYTDRSWCWTDLSRVSNDDIIRSGSGWILKLPRVINVNEIK